VRDLVVRQRLETLAGAAAERLRALVAAGEEVPYEITGPGDGSPFSQYTPQSARFVREHWAQLAELDAFSEACTAIAGAEIAAPYLERLGEPVPPDADRCAEAAAIAFLSRVWQGSGDFALEGERLSLTLDELDGCAETGEVESEIVAPLIGFHMPATRLPLDGTTVVRGDVVELPDEIRRAEGARRSPFEGQFLGVVRSPDPESAVSPGASLRELVTTLRLFKPGGVGLGPYAWAKTPGDRWKRLATGVARPRAGGYRLTDSELADLVALSSAVGGRSGEFARAISRFEAGLERPALLEALSDYLLALRFLLEGGGAADVGLPMRAAAISGAADERAAIKSKVEHAVALESALIRGEVPAKREGEGPLEIVAGVEELVRSILRETASGLLGADPRAAADEALLADGLAVGEGAGDVRGETAEWGAVDPQPQPATHPVAPGRAAEDATGIDAEEAIGVDAEPVDLQENDSEQPTEVLMTPKITKRERSETRDERPEDTDWLSEVDESHGDTLDWPERPEALKLLDQRPAERERARRRVRHLFPRPETTEWGVAELQYDRRRRARV
jgi:hypothetical protein